MNPATRTITPETRFASCSCGAIRLAAHGQPLRVGLFHCTTCRKESGAPFTANAIFRTEDVTVQGDTTSWKDWTDVRHFCPSCGSSVFGVSGGTGEIEILLGAFDVASTNLVPAYELWVGRRENLVAGAARYSSLATDRDLLAVDPDQILWQGANEIPPLCTLRLLTSCAGE